jgi:hypothetical protein
MVEYWILYGNLLCSCHVKKNKKASNRNLFCHFFI